MWQLPQHLSTVHYSRKILANQENIGKCHTLNSSQLPIISCQSCNVASMQTEALLTWSSLFYSHQRRQKSSNKPLYIDFIDFNEVFDTMNQDCLLGLLGKLGCPLKADITHPAVTHWHASTSVNQWQHLSVIPYGTGCHRQGCAVAPTLFSMYLAVVLELCLSSLCKGVYISTRFDGKLFNLRRLKSKTKIRDY